MARKKNDENIVITEPDFSEDPVFSESENSPYEPDMAPVAKKNAPETSHPSEEPDSEEKTGVFVKLVGGGSFTTGEYFFRRGEAVPVPSALAKKLMKTGFFKKV